ncbi:MAG: L-serine ammonia-lyase, iron-sulfur-dependent, subunit alpha [bacterium]|nr:L-serine ammonia-lyase, iron-sulfur-dependent, subunit alpha [bacterium]
MHADGLKLSELISDADGRGISLGQLALEQAVRLTFNTSDCLRGHMRLQWRVMQEAMEAGLQSPRSSRSGLVGFEGSIMNEWVQDTRGTGAPVLKLAARAMSASCINACMGRIVAAPTAGACGILPAVIACAQEDTGCSEDSCVDALFAAGLIGVVISGHIELAGASGGCQAECGSAAAMAAAAAVQIYGGSPERSGHAAALALKNLLGLVCDPVAGLVEIPCVKRNGFLAVHAWLAAQMALAGMNSAVPADEVFAAMAKIGRSMPEGLRETSTGGLAVTPTGQEIRSKMDIRYSSLD